MEEPGKSKGMDAWNAKEEKEDGDEEVGGVGMGEEDVEDEEEEGGDVDAGEGYVNAGAVVEEAERFSRMGYTLEELGIGLLLG